MGAIFVRICGTLSADANDEGGDSTALSEKQKRFLREADHRWNIKVGATRSGKTYCDYFMIPRRVRACTGSGLIVLIGHTVGTLSRNILDPMRLIWGEKLVGTPVSSSDTVTLFGKKCYLIGADRISQTAKLQGAGIEYCYGDEITTWREELFSMLKSRLDKPDSRFDGTCNPDAPSHWFKRFLDSDADIYAQSYTIDDNPFLSPDFVRELKKEYSGTVYYDRYILGRWCAAEGAVFPRFAAQPSRFILSRDAWQTLSPIRLVLGVDFGGTKSGTSFVATCFTEGVPSVAVLASRRYTGEMDADRLSDRFCLFAEECTSVTGLPAVAYCDNAESVLIRSLRGEVLRRGLPVSVRNAAKTPINDRIRLVTRLLARDQLALSPDCDTLRQALCDARWNPRLPYDQRLDDGSSDIDSLDAFEYTLEHEASRLLR